MDLEKFIIAIATTKKDKVSGGASVFHCADENELQNIVNLLEAILDGVAHKLYEGMYIIVKH
jgi:hypothetical protein